jgi:hypothetical protein
MSLEIDGQVIATAEFREHAAADGHGAWIVSWPEHLRAWLARFSDPDDVAFAVEGCTGWRYVAEELAAAGVAAHLAEPATAGSAKEEGAWPPERVRPGHPGLTLSGLLNCVRPLGRGCA